MKPLAVGTSLSLLLASWLAAPLARADEPSVRRIEDVRWEKAQEEGKYKITILGQGLAGVGSVQVDGAEVTSFLPTDDTVYATVAELQSGTHEVRLRWGKLVSEPHELCAPKPLHVEPPSCVLEPVLFPLEKSTLDDAAKETIARNAKCIRSSGQTDVVLFGFESMQGSAPRLSENRSTAVRDELTSQAARVDPVRSGLWKQLPAVPVPLPDDPREIEIERSRLSQRVMFAHKGRLVCASRPMLLGKSFDASAGGDEKRRAEMEAEIDLQLRCFEAIGVTALLLVFPQGKEQWDEYRKIVAMVQSRLAATAADEAVNGVEMKLYAVTGTPSQVRTMNKELGRWIEPELRDNDRGVYLLPLQWHEPRKASKSAATAAASNCPSIAIAQPEPLKIPCKPCESPQTPILPPTKPLKLPRGFASARVSGLRSFDSAFVGGGVRAARLLGPGPLHLALGLDVSAHGSSNVHSYPSGDSVPLLVVPAASIGAMYRGASVQLGMTLLAGPFLPLFNGAVFDFEVGVGLRITDKVALLGAVAPGVAITNEAVSRLQVGFGAAVDFE